MWTPKHKDNKLYTGKMARIYYKDGHNKHVPFVEGMLIYIWESKTRKDSYSVQILDNDNKFTRHTCTSDIIKKIEIEMFEIDDNVNLLCEKYLVDDVGSVINQYVNNYVEI